MESKATNTELQKRILMLLKSKKLTKVLIDDFPFSSLGTLARIRDGQFPRTHKIRALFGLAGMIAVASCPNCDSVHTRKCSPKKPKLNRMATKADLELIIEYVTFFKGRESDAIA